MVHLRSINSPRRRRYKRKTRLLRACSRVWNEVFKGVLIGEDQHALNNTFLFLGCSVIGIIAGLRSLTAPALVGCAAHIGWLDLNGSRLHFLG